MTENRACTIFCHLYGLRERNLNIVELFMSKEGRNAAESAIGAALRMALAELLRTVIYLAKKVKLGIDKYRRQCYTQLRCREKDNKTE